MKSFYLVYCITIVAVATFFNYLIATPGSNRSWSSSGSYYSSGSGWHK